METNTNVKSGTAAATHSKQLPAHLLGKPLCGYVDWLQRRHGLTDVGASLAAITAVLSAVGPSRRILNPLDLSCLPPTLNLVLYGSPVLNIRAGLNVCLDPIRQWIFQRVDGRKHDSRRVRLRIAELHNELIQKEFVLRNTVQRIVPGIDSCLATEQELAVRREEIETQKRDILREINDESFRLAPCVITDDAPLRRLLNPGGLSYDGAVLNASVTGHAVTMWTQSTRAEKAELARLLTLSCNGFQDSGEAHVRPLLSNVIVTESAGARALLTDRDLSSTGVNANFCFIDAMEPDAVMDLFAPCADEVAEQWTAGLQALITSRTAGTVTDYQFGAEAVARFQQHLNTNSMGKATIGQREPTPALVLALLCHAGSSRDDAEVADSTLEFAIALADAVRDSTRIISKPQRLERSTSTDEDAELEALVAKVRVRGSLRWRELLRGRRMQKADPLVRLLDKALSTGRLRKRGDAYYAVEESISA